MQIKPEEITSILEKEIDNLDWHAELKEIGHILQVGDGIARVYGLENVQSGEMVKFPNQIYGLVFNLEESNVGCVVLGDSTKLKEGDVVERTGKLMSVPTGESLLGRMVNALGDPIDDGGSLENTTPYAIERVAPGVCERQPVKEPLQTGIKCIDAMIPVGRGQRELIIGDRKTGKTAIALDTIINQKDQDVICVYVAIGQKQSTVSQIWETLKANGAMEYTTIVTATAADSATLQFLAPYAGCAMGEYFLDRGKHVLVIYDDLSKHAVAYRQLSLLLKRPPGREAYPGDVFYLHSRLLERALKYSDEKGAGSLTALPIIETQAGDVSAYIPTNVISITDGQIYLETDLFNAGIKPAVNPGISVSRVGGNAQIKATKQVSGSLRLDLSQYWEMEAFAQFGSDLDASTVQQLERGKRIIEILKQDQFNPLRIGAQISIIYAVTKGFLDSVELNKVKEFEKELHRLIAVEFPTLLDEIEKEKKLSDSITQQIEKAVLDCQKLFIN